MKKCFILMSVLMSGLLLAQEKDSINTSLDEVIINKQIRKDTETSNKMPLKFIENPQVLSIIDKSVLENQVLFTVDDAYRNVTGLQKMWNATGRSGDGGSYVTFRGFVTNSSLRNGLVAPVTTTIDAINLESIEVLKGPSATMFGSNVGSYGGIINRITKKPHEEFSGNVTIAGGSYNYYRTQADINAPITNDKKLMFRINTAYTNSGTFQMKDIQNEYHAFSPSLRYKPNDKLDINVDFEMYENKAMGEQMFFYLNPSLDLGIRNMKDVEKKLGLDYKQSYVGDDLKTKARVRNIFGQVNYKINDHIKSSTNVSNSYSNSNGMSPYFYIGPNATGTEFGVKRADQSTVNSKKTFFQVQQNFNFDYKFGEIRNRTVVGFDYMKTKNDQMFMSTTFGNDESIGWVPFKGGNYSSMNAASVRNYYNNKDNKDIGLYPIEGDLDTYSGYISNVFTPLEGLNILAAVRYENNDAKGGILYSNSTKSYSQSAWSPKFGVVYEIIPGNFSVFGNYQNSFKSNGYYTIDTNLNTALSDPERANQFEGGFKTNILQGKINTTFSYYNINVKNSLLYTGQYAGSFSVQTQAGKTRSEGVELEVNAYLVRGFSIIGGLAYNDSKITKNPTDETLVGTRPTTAGSKWLANFNATYQFLEGSLKGFGVGVGGNYASNNYVTNSFYLPEYFTLNTNAFYDAKKFRIAVKVDNLTNKHYWIGYSTANPQQLVNAVGSLTYKF